MEKIVATACKLSHKQFRAVLKKFRRKKIRQRLAKEREQQEILERQKKENSPGYKEKEEDIRRNSELYDQFEERERIRDHKQWLLREQQAQDEFRKKQEKLEFERIRNEEERKRIVAEFEKQQYVDDQAEKEMKKVKSKKEEVLQEVLSNLSEADGPWHNPMAPENYNAGQEREQCMFFSKTGCCRFGERCSRGHTRPAVSCTILIRGMYSHFSIDQTGRDDYDADIALEYEDKERYQDFKNFYTDVLPEFRKFGKVVQFKVCNNFEPHLRGNVYVQFSREEEAVEAYKSFNGRYYAGKQITCEFTHVIRWRSAICGLNSRNLCPKGMNCNFLHVFRNPNDEFWEANRDLRPWGIRRNRDRSNHYSSDHRHKHESRSDRHESRNYNDSRNDRYEPRNDRYEPRSERHEYRNDRYESRSRKYESRSSRYNSKDNYDSSSSSGSHDGDRTSCHKKNMKHKDNSSQDRKRSRDSSSRSRSRSRSRSPAKASSSNHKNRKHKKKKSKKHKKKLCSDSNSDYSTG